MPSEHIPVEATVSAMFVRGLLGTSSAAPGSVSHTMYQVAYLCEQLGLHPQDSLEDVRRWIAEGRVET